jgi:hypothetical protein
VGQYLNLTKALVQSGVRVNPVTDDVMGAVLHYIIMLEMVQVRIATGVTRVV